MAFDRNQVDERDQFFAKQFGYKIIPLACTRSASYSRDRIGFIEAWIGPTLVHQDHPLASARGKHLHIEASNGTPNIYGWREDVLLPENQIVTAHYVRLTVEDKPLVLADLAKAIADQNINICEVRQPMLEKEVPEEGALVEIAFLLDTCKVEAVSSAVAAIRSLPVCLAVNTVYKVLGNPTRDISRKQ